MFLSAWAIRLRKDRRWKRTYYNFEALNLPKNHPARDMQDSFYITDDILDAYAYVAGAGPHDEGDERPNAG